MDSPFQRYLEAKRSVDDRALNRGVLASFSAALRAIAPEPRVLEIGAGSGTMVERLVEWGVLHRAEYTLLDADPALLAAGRQRLSTWAAGRGAHAENDGEQLRIEGPGFALTLVPRAAELFAFLEDSARTPAEPSFDALVACAVLDLVDVPRALPMLWSVLRPGAPFWLTINFDGESVFCPELPLDGAVWEHYHRSMDERVRDGRPAGDSKTGRHLFEHLRRSGASVTASGSSDWVVFAGRNGYPAREAEFLRHILATIGAELDGHPAIARGELGAWLELRSDQIAAGELVYLAHQLDFAGHAPLDRG
jgi:SAM-dependent methyltransferase